MNSVIKSSARLFGAFVVGVIALVLVLILVSARSTHAVSSDTGNQKGRVITIHDRGQDTVIVSEASTIGDALKEAGVSIDAKDAVEPLVDEKLIASDYQINIYRARPVVVIDGNVRIKIVTPYQTADQITRSAGIALSDEDITTIDRNDDILTDGAGLKMTIKRATGFTFMLYGKTSQAYTQAATVGEMLAKKGIKLGTKDKVEPSIDTPMTSGMTVRLWREGKQTITVEESIPFETDQIEDADQNLGYLLVNTPGQNGSKSVTYEVVIQDGREVCRQAIASLVLAQPIKQLQTIGVKGKYNTPTENENITWDFLIQQGFSRLQTAGIMGNLMQEHRFNTSDSAGGYGIVQWTGSRRTALMALPYPDNIYTQLNFLMSELNGGYAGVRDAIKASTTLEDATIIFQNRFERCGICRQDLRLQYASDILASH